MSRVQVAEQDAARKVQEELDRPCGFIGGWRTVDTDLDVGSRGSALSQAPGPLEEGGAMLLSLKRDGEAQARPSEALAARRPGIGG